MTTNPSSWRLDHRAAREGGVRFEAFCAGWPYASDSRHPAVGEIGSVVTEQYVVWYRARSRRDLGSAMRSARKREGVTQIELAERLNISRSTVQRLEHGEDVSVEAVLSSIAELGLEAIIVPKGAHVIVPASKEQAERAHAAMFAEDERT